MKWRGHGGKLSSTAGIKEEKGNERKGEFEWRGKRRDMERKNK